MSKQRTHDDSPTERQLAYLRHLSERAGETFTCPATKQDASREIKRLECPPPTQSQVELIRELNGKLGTDYPVPDSEGDARFLIDGLVDAERRAKRQAMRRT